MRLDDDDFALFGLPRRHRLDTAEMGERWRALQARVHPDRFAADGRSAQRLAMQWAVRVNEAYRRLRDPVTRGAYLCELAGVPVDAQRHTGMPQSFLLQQIAWREALSDRPDPADVKALSAEVGVAEQDLRDALSRQLDDDADPTAAAATVRALMFVSRFRRDLERQLEDA
jgi:molecular chaperone HscB